METKAKRKRPIQQGHQSSLFQPINHGWRVKKVLGVVSFLERPLLSSLDSLLLAFPDDFLLSPLRVLSECESVDEATEMESERRLLLREMISTLLALLLLLLLSVVWTGVSRESIGLKELIMSGEGLTPAEGRRTRVVCSDAISRVLVCADRDKRRGTGRARRWIKGGEWWGKRCE